MEDKIELAKFKACLIFCSRKQLGTKTSRSLKEQDYSMEVSISLHSKSEIVILVILDRLSESAHSLTLKLYIC